MGSAVSLRLKMWKGADGGADHDVGHWKAIIPLWATSQTFRKCRSFLSLGALRLRFFGTVTAQETELRDRTAAAL